ncbi:MAG: ABC transporter ATP-binding protein [Bacilli bacterium]|jgi:ATP-binding cassette subfamily B protein|nr:ABC transporter ATP-binding protein [Bacilli bacterium]MDY0063808.1 ABC transporter ATP-binding protein [Bacilli bacterium]
MNSFEEQDYSKDKLQFSIWKKIIKMVLKKKMSLTIMIFSMLSLSFLDIINPIINANAITHFFENRNYTEVGLYIFLYVGMALGYMLTIWLFIRMAGKVEVEIGYEIRKEAFVKLQELPFSYYDKTPAGWIMARLTSDSRKLASILSWGLVDIIWGAFTMVGTLIVLFIIKWELALIVTAMTPILLLVSMYFRKKILTAYREVRRTNSKITASYNEEMLGSKTTKTLVLEDTLYNEFDRLSDDMKRQSIRAILHSSIYFPILIFLGYVTIAGILRIGGEFVLLGMSVVVLYLFINYTTMFFEPVAQIARVIAEFQQAQASAERIIMLIETKADISDSPDVVKKYGTLFEPKKENWEPLVGDVEFDNVSFQYTDNEIVLDQFSLKVKAGSSVALVGATGSGKSTIVNLICRFYEPTKGVIRIDGTDYKDRSIGWLHSNLGYVLQSPHLFNGTIMENIRYGRLDAADEEVIHAAKLVSAHEFIMSFEEGYQTNVGEGGSKLSVGQRQLISFARALIADPKILILDEATSSIDTKTEYTIQEVINVVLKGRTSFIVAHRLSTIISADLILVIQDGKIVEQGTHKELLALEKEYYSLYKNQFINEAMEKSKY